ETQPKQGAELRRWPRTANALRRPRPTTEPIRRVRGCHRPRVPFGSIARPQSPKRPHRGRSSLEAETLTCVQFARPRRDGRARAPSREPLREPVIRKHRRELPNSNANLGHALATRERQPRSRLWVAPLLASTWVRSQPLEVHPPFGPGEPKSDARRVRRNGRGAVFAHSRKRDPEGHPLGGDARKVNALRGARTMHLLATRRRCHPLIVIHEQHAKGCASTR